MYYYKPKKTEYITFNVNKLIIIINNHTITESSVVKYLGLYIDNNLNWKFHISHVTKICCPRIGKLKKVMQFLPKFAIILYYNAFIKSSFSYATMFWLNNFRSDRYKLITKVDKLISCIRNKYKFSIENFCNINTAFKRQCLIFMYDLVKNNLLFFISRSLPILKYMITLHYHVTIYSYY